ncbi:hypothetical protein ACFX1X_013359 [Malus domestica]
MLSCFHHASTSPSLPPAVRTASSTTSLYSTKPNSKCSRSSDPPSPTTTTAHPAQRAPKLSLALPTPPPEHSTIIIPAAAKATQASDIAIVLASSEGLSVKSNTASAIASGTVLGIYEDGRYKSESKKSALKSVDILGLGTGAEVEKKLKY